MENSRFYYMQNYCCFAIARNKFLSMHRYKTENGFVAPHIGFIEAGSVLLKFEDFSLEANEGDVIFIPPKLPYSSEWNGTPEIDMFVLEVETDLLDSLYIPAQVISLPTLSAAFESLHKKAFSEECEAALSELFFILGTAKKRLSVYRQGQNKATECAKAYIEQNLTEIFSVEKLATLCNLSQSRFFALFKEENGMSPINYKNFLRIKKGMIYLKRDKLSVEEICERLNFSSPAYFRRLLKKFTGKTPSQIAHEHEM